MNIILLIIVVAVILFVLDKRGYIKLFASFFQPKYFRWYGGIFAWLIMFFFIAFLVNCVQAVLTIRENPASMGAAAKFIELAMMMIGIGYLYQSIIVYSPSGSLYSPLMLFLRLLIFREERVHTTDLFELVENVQKKKEEIKKEELKRKRKLQILAKREKPKPKRYFRQD
ncbi:MAG: hypothetical protein HY960_11495 [Ignavibacteriae bacterium]|nr:hypothetical protein [Ignavibacteriota bacterium]